MQIGAVTFQPYIYPIGGLSSRSLYPVDSLPEDALSGRTGFLEPAAEENPLHRGETRNFGDIIDMQLHIGADNAARLMPDAVSGGAEELKVEEIAESAPDMDGDADNLERMQMPDTEQADKARALRNVSDTVGDVNTTSTVQGAGEETDAGMYGRTGNMAEFTPYKVSMALDAYSAWMSA